MTTRTQADRLLAVLPPYERHTDTLRAVVELRKPLECVAGCAGMLCAGCNPDNDLTCSEAPWPCPTILAVADGLGVEVKT